MNPPHDQPSINVFIAGAESKFKWLGTNVLTPEGKPFGGSSWIDVREYPLRGKNGDDGTRQRSHGGHYRRRLLTACDSLLQCYEWGCLASAPWPPRTFRSPTLMSPSHPSLHVRVLQSPATFVQCSHAPLLVCPLPPAAAKDAVKALLEEHKVDVIVAVTHISLPQDKELATKVPEIDVRTSAIHRTTRVNVSLSRALLVQIIIGGHDHVPYCLFEHKVFIMKVGQNAEYLGRIDINYTRNDLAKPNAQAREKGTPLCCFCQQLYRAVSESCFRCRAWCV